MAANDDHDAADEAYRIAESLIAHASHSHATSLYFRGLAALDRIPESLSRLSAVERLGFNDTKIADLSPLCGLNSLRWLDLDGTQVSDLSPLRGLRALSTLYLSGTRVSDLSPLSELSVLGVLHLDDTEVSDLSPLSGLGALRMLHLNDTQISDLSPLSGLNALSMLHLDGTQISDLSPISGLSALRRLDLDRTQVSDLSPLIELRKLVGDSDNGLSFLDCPKLPSEIQELSRFETRERTHRTLNYLRYQQGLLPLPFERTPSDRTIKEFVFQTLDAEPRPFSVDEIIETFAAAGYSVPEPSIRGCLNRLDSKGEIKRLSRGVYASAEYTEEAKPPSREGIDLAAEVLEEWLTPEPRGARVEVQGDRFAISKSGEEDDVEASLKPVVRQLHKQCIQKAAMLAERVQRMSNQPGWANLRQTLVQFRKVIEQPTEDLAEHVAEAWSLSVSLGCLVEQDDAARTARGSMVEPLEADARWLLADLVQTAGPFVRQFPTARNLDDDLASFHSASDHFDAAVSTVNIAVEVELLNLPDGELILAVVDTAHGTGHQSEKARDWSIYTARNIAAGALLFVVGSVTTGALAQVGTEVAQQSRLAGVARDFLLRSESEIVDLTQRLPADVRAAIREVTRWLRRSENAKNAPGETQGPPSTD
ncbi:MAG: leucine-rich repeat domain-containing protein [Parvibaculum sp.]|uniref:leucine-rich repeat domain-containing protein n=1 Tax=Parvibaculum sp. TaxID=2024848 RepID=UPI0032639841